VLRSKGEASTEEAVASMKTRLGTLCQKMGKKRYRNDYLAGMGVLMTVHRSLSRYAAREERRAAMWDATPFRSSKTTTLLLTISYFNAAGGCFFVNDPKKKGMIR